MKKVSFALMALILFVNCSTSQDVNKSQNNQKARQEILVGKQERKALIQEPYSNWFVQNYEEYDVDIDQLPILKPLLKGVKIKVFMGTWCGDSKRETPRFYKIMDAAKVSKRKISLITMDRTKQTPEKWEEGLNITNVPTFIFYKNGKEINRIVEYPLESLEKDMIAILSDSGYKHAYAE